ncbi:uncharacterized protein TNCV_4850821 [Trichonephila clavipes]|nr:uncharacterized protein TNCV_4850821 [Trichonephila clavipes]
MLFYAVDSLVVRASHSRSDGLVSLPDAIKVHAKVATVGSAVIGFKECGFEVHNRDWRFIHDFAASKATDHDVVGDETQNNAANPQTLIVEKNINPPEEPKLMANADYDALKKPVSVFCFKTLPKATQFTSISKYGVIRNPACEEKYCDPPTEEWAAVAQWLRYPTMAGMS